MTSPWAREPSAQMMAWLVLSLRNLTEPSQNSELAPPGWKLRRPNDPGASMVSLPLVLQLGAFEFGGTSRLPMLQPKWPNAQLWPSDGVLTARGRVVSPAEHWFSHAGRPATRAGL